MRGNPARDEASTVDVVLAGLLWLLSGSPVLTYAPYYDVTIFVGAVIFAGYMMVRGSLYPRRLIPFIALGSAFVAWAAAWLLFKGDSSQMVPLVGHLLKLVTVGLFVAVCYRPGEALVRSMVWLSTIALVIFALRQLGLHGAGVDIADLFNWFYPMLGVEPDRSILIYNFDIPSEIGRNSGPFREPGLFAAYLVISLMILLACSPNMKGGRKQLGKYAAVLALALLSTQSTMGLSAGPVVLAMWLIGNRAMSRASVLAMVVGAGLIGSAIWLTGGQNDKLLGQSQAVESAAGAWHTTRLGNAYVDWVAIQESPVIGLGFAEEARPILWVGEAEVGFGNGLTGTAVKFGLPFAALIYGFFLVGFRRLFRTPLVTVLAIVVLGMLLVGQQLLTLPLAFALIGRLEPERLQSVRHSQRRRLLRQPRPAGPSFTPA